LPFPAFQHDTRGVTANRSKDRRRWGSWLLLAGVLLLVGAPVAAIAQEQALGGKFRTGDEVVVAADETVAGDLYASAGTVRIEGTVEGDLVAAGGQVEISGEVGGDVLVGSGSVDISGDVGGDVRAGAGQVTVGGSIGEDLLVAAGQVTIMSSGSVGEDFVFGAGRATMDGRIEGDVLGATGNYSRGGTVGGTEDVTITRPAEEREPTFGDRVLGAVRRFIALFAVAALLLWLLPWSIQGTAKTLRERPVTSLGFGALGLFGSIAAVVVTLIAVILLAILLGLLTLGELVALIIFAWIVAIIVFAFLLYVVMGYVAHAAVGIAVAGLGPGRRPTSGARRWALLGVGLLVVVIVTSIPVVGGWFGFLIALFGLGAFMLAANARRRPTAAPSTPPPPMPMPST
jgi:cytoskeletal protein CcmA (bactofilin family)